MVRTAAVALVSAVIGALLTLALAGSSAHAEGTRVDCTQVPQRPGQVDEQYVAAFMSEQLGKGKLHFTTIPGVSTVLCAW